jgi:arogenate dehydrogenase (NADP+)
LISHMPVLVSAALLEAAERGGRAAGAAALVRQLASSGFADTSRIGGGNPELGTLMARCNQGAVLQAIQHYRQQLSELEALVEQNAWPALQQRLEHCQALRPEFL